MATTWLQTRIPRTDYHSIFKECTFASKQLEEKHYQIVREIASDQTFTAKQDRWTRLRILATYAIHLVGP